MKKILTITCHNVYNHGATLQQMALLVYLKSLNFDAKTINYKPKYLSNHYKLWLVNNEKFEKNIFLKFIYLSLKLPSRLLERVRKNNFDQFEKKYLDVLPQKYSTNKELKNNLPEADFYITGSDQVWNSFFDNGKDPAFYLDFVPDNKPKIAYAASFAIDSIEPSLTNFVKEKVSRLQHISVREKSGVQILENLGFEKVSQVIDPVFLMNAEYWTTNFVKPISQDYVFIYDFDGNENIKKTAIELSKKHNLKIFTVNERINYASKKYVNSGPEIFLSLVHHAKYVLTNSFHAVAFSLIFNKKFLVFNRTEKINTRMRDLLQMVELSEILVEINETKDIDLIPFDFNNSNKIISNKVLESKKFLEEALK